MITSLRLLKVLCAECFREQTDPDDTLLVFFSAYVLSRVRNLHKIMAWTMTYIHVRTNIRWEPVNVFVTHVNKIPSSALLYCHVNE